MPLFSLYEIILLSKNENHRRTDKCKLAYHKNKYSEFHILHFCLKIGKKRKKSIYYPIIGKTSF